MDNFVNQHIRCRICRQIELYEHLRMLYIASANAPTDALELPAAPPNRFIATPMELHDFVEDYMTGYVNSCCDSHRDTDSQQCITVLFVLDHEREVHEPPDAPALTAAERFARREAAVNRRILSEVLDVTILLYGNVESRYFTPLFKRLRVGSHYIQTQHWLTEILKYLCDSCCFGHSHLTEESLSLQSRAMRGNTFERAQELLQLQVDRAALRSTHPALVRGSPMRSSHRRCADDNGTIDDQADNDRVRRLLLLDAEEDTDDEARMSSGSGSGSNSDHDPMSSDDGETTDDITDDINDVVEIILQPRDGSRTRRILQYGQTAYAYCHAYEMEE